MQTYLVGGAVRDLLMGRQPADRDYVVVGATPQQMLDQGYKAVGKDFPVFLHPETGEEYALARTERKTGDGYTGFSTEHEGVSLAEDLRRRDLTCNAVAIDPATSEVIDPFGGASDIRNRVLRHVSEAFREDPVRVLRLARLSAKLGFAVAPETAALCREMVAAGELDHLTPERVQQEMLKALPTYPSRFFIALDEVGALETLFPEIHALKGQTQPAKHHGEGDAFAHTMMVIDDMRHAIAAMPERHENRPDLDIGLNVFAALCHDLGKGITPKEALPRHLGHEEAGVPIVEAFCQRLKMPRHFERVAVKVTRYHGHVHQAAVMTPRAFRKAFEGMSGIHQFADIETVARVARSDERGRICRRTAAYVAADQFMAVMRAIASVRIAKSFSAQEIGGMTQADIQQALIKLRHAAASGAIQNFKSHSGIER